MMMVTDRHQRALMRVLTRRTLLYTEMITTGALLRGRAAARLAAEAEGGPVAIQLGGDDPASLAACSSMAAETGFDEVDLNAGCPSPRVARGSFGACLMKEPERVADAVAAMRAACALPVTVKHRVGVDEVDGYEDLARFVRTVASAGCDRFVVHARKAWLDGLSPSANRSVPPLRRDLVHRLKDDFPSLAVEINGGFADLDSVLEQLAHLDGVMIGRAADADPFLFAAADPRIFGEAGPVASRQEAALAMVPRIEREAEAGVPLPRLLRPMLGLFAGQPGSRAWRRALSEGAKQGSEGGRVVRDALGLVEAAAARSRQEDQP